MKRILTALTTTLIVALAIPLAEADKPDRNPPKDKQNCLHIDDEPDPRIWWPLNVPIPVKQYSEGIYEGYMEWHPATYQYTKGHWEIQATCEIIAKLKKCLKDAADCSDAQAEFWAGTGITYDGNAEIQVYIIIESSEPVPLEHYVMTNDEFLQWMAV